MRHAFRATVMIAAAAGALSAMAGERLKPGACTEVSGVCTHPDHRGKGYAGRLVTDLVFRRERDDLRRRWLSVPADRRPGLPLSRATLRVPADAKAAA